MKTEAFLEEHPVQLSEEEKRLRASTASRAWPRLADHEKAIDDAKAAHKAALLELEGEKRATIARAREASRAAHEGHEPRKVWVRQAFLAPNQVITIRVDTDETVGDRVATDDEIREHEKAAREASKAKPLDAAQVQAKLAAALGAIDAKPHAPKWVEGQLAKALPAATPSEIKAAIAAAIDDGRLLEDDGKLRAGTPRQPGDEGIVEDDYRPAAPH